MTVPATKRILEFNKAVIDVSLGTSRAVAGAVTEGAGRAWKSVRDSGATVAGQARVAVDRTAGEATTGAKQVAGQARAQGKIASEQVGDIVDRTARKATSAVDPRPSSGTPYEEWSRTQLYERAKEVGLEGRSSMSKQQLITALRSG